MSTEPGNAQRDEPARPSPSTAAAAPPAAVVTAAAQMRVVRGAPDDLEVAALVAGLVAVASSADLPDDAPVTGQWVRRSRPGKASPTGGDSWRWSLR